MPNETNYRAKRQESVVEKQCNVHCIQWSNTNTDKIWRDKCSGPFPYPPHHIN